QSSALIDRSLVIETEILVQCARRRLGLHRWRRTRGSSQAQVRRTLFPVRRSGQSAVLLITDTRKGSELSSRFVLTPDASERLVRAAWRCAQGRDGWGRGVLRVAGPDSRQGLGGTQFLPHRRYRLDPGESCLLAAIRPVSTTRKSSL